MDIKQIILNFYTVSRPEYSIGLTVQLVLIAAAFLVVVIYKPRWKYVAYCVLIVLLLRIAIFGQYISWGFYNNQLKVDDVGWRQQSELPIEYNKFFKNRRKIKFLAVGSSQTYAVYLPYSEKHKELDVFNLAGMSPLDFYLYRKYIAARDSDYILLYLSEFDLAKQPQLSASKDAPAQGISLIEVFPMLFKIAQETFHKLALAEMMTGEFFPEYKYSFIFKGLSEKVMKKNETLKIRSPYEELAPDAEQLNDDIESMLKNMDEKWIKYQMYFLEKFIAYCKSKSLKVIIVEGEYNPLAYTEKSVLLNQVTRAKLEGLTKTFDNVTFLSRADVKKFTKDDFYDAVHVKSSSGYFFVEDLVSKFAEHSIR